MPEIEIPVPEEVAKGEIIRSLVGSTLHGTGLAGQEDTDYMGVCVEPWADVLGMGKFEQWIWRSAATGERSGPDDIDITIYGLGKYLRLAVSGNPTILLLLFVGEENLTVQTEWGKRLQELAPAIVSQRCAPAFEGYCHQQKLRLEGVQGGRHTNRPELIEVFGYDTKYAMHALRLAYQGQEILSTGRISLPIPDPWGETLRAIRRGEVEYEDYLKLLEEEFAKLKTLASNEARKFTIGGKNVLPEQPNIEAINEFLKDARLDTWKL